MMSFWPREAAWEISTFNLGQSNPALEAWQLDRQAKISRGEAELNSAKGWKDWARGDTKGRLDIKTNAITYPRGHRSTITIRKVMETIASADIEAMLLE